MLKKTVLDNGSLISNFDHTKKLVYVAGPISSDPIHNTRNAIDIWKTLFDNGFIAVIPHLSILIEMIHPIHEKWYEYDLHLLYKCDMVLRLPGQSIGADLEVEFAEKFDIPIFYNLEDLFNYEKS